MGWGGFVSIRPGAGPGQYEGIEYAFLYDWPFFGSNHQEISEHVITIITINKLLSQIKYFIK